MSLFVFLEKRGLSHREKISLFWKKRYTEEKREVGVRDARNSEYPEHREDHHAQDDRQRVLHPPEGAPVPAQGDADRD
jgi:hypothetical protein